MSVLKDLTDRAERVRSKILTSAEGKIADHQHTPLARHFDEYLQHLEAGGASEVYLADTKRLATRLFDECGFNQLPDIQAEPAEKWLAQQAKRDMAARTRNSYLQAVRGFCNWWVERDRLAVNLLAKVKRANENADRRRQRRAMPEAELVRLLYVTRLRPLTEYGRETIHKQQSEPKARKRWTTAPLTLDNIEDATERARDRLEHKLHFVEQQERLGWERALVYKTLMLTGLRKAELASLTIGQALLDGPMPYLDLDPADEKNREGSQMPLRRDLADDLTE